MVTGFKNLHFKQSSCLTPNRHWNLASLGPHFPECKWTINIFLKQWQLKFTTRTQRSSTQILKCLQIKHNYRYFRIKCILMEFKSSYSKSLHTPYLKQNILLTNIPYFPSWDYVCNNGVEFEGLPYSLLHLVPNTVLYILGTPKILADWL